VKCICLPVWGAGEMSDEQPTYDRVELAKAISAVEQAIEALSPFDISTSHIQQTLVQLKSKQDPWYEAKQGLEIYLKSHHCKAKAVAQYALHLEQELYNRKPLWIVLPADADADDLHFRPNGGLMEYVFLDEHAAEHHRQKAVSPDEYRVQEVWGK
jgi:hypothetical protein